MANKNGVQVWRGQMRLPQPMIDWVKNRADDNFRSVNAELVELVREAMKRRETENAAQ